MQALQVAHNTINAIHTSHQRRSAQGIVTRQATELHMRPEGPMTARASRATITTSRQQSIMNFPPRRLKLLRRCSKRFGSCWAQSLPRCRACVALRRFRRVSSQAGQTGASEDCRPSATGRGSRSLHRGALPNSGAGGLWPTPIHHLVLNSQASTTEIPVAHEPGQPRAGTGSPAGTGRARLRCHGPREGHGAGEVPRMPKPRVGFQNDILFTYTHEYIYIYTYVYYIHMQDVCMYACMYVCMYVPLSIYVSRDRSICLSACLSLYLSISVPLSFSHIPRTNIHGCPHVRINA